MVEIVKEFLIIIESSLTSGPENIHHRRLWLCFGIIWLDQPSFTLFPRPPLQFLSVSPTSPWDENPVCTKELNERLRQCRFFFSDFWMLNDGYFGSCSSGRGGCWQNSDQTLKSHWFSSGKGLPIDPETRDVSFDDCLPCIIALGKILNNHGRRSTITALITCVVKETCYFFAQQLHVSDMFTSSSNPGVKWRSKLFIAWICTFEQDCSYFTFFVLSIICIWKQCRLPAVAKNGGTLAFLRTCNRGHGKSRTPLPEARERGQDWNLVPCHL